MKELPAYSHVLINDLRPYAKNSRTHSDEQINQVVKSIKEFGFTNPILIDKDNNIIAGHCRTMAALKIGLTHAPCIVLSDLTPDQIKAYVIADNKLALNAGWDINVLLSEVNELKESGYDFELTGFNSGEIDALTPQVMSVGLTDDDAVPDVPVDPITKLGDVWVLGDHRLMCGDSTSIDAVDKLMNGEKADMVFTDPPYGMNYSGRGKNTSEKILNDNIDPTEFYNLIPEITERYIWGRIENYVHLLQKPRDVIIWKKNNFGMGAGYRGQYEVCFYFGDFKGSDSDVWDVSKDSNYDHPTQKPVALAERAIKNSNPKAILDLFGGSGATLIACEKTGRKCYMMELAPNYCDVIIKRWEQFTGKKAMLCQN